MSELPYTHTVVGNKCTYPQHPTGKGHFSRAVGGRTRHSIFIPVSDDFKAEDFCS